MLFLVICVFTQIKYITQTRPTTKLKEEFGK